MSKIKLLTRPRALLEACEGWGVYSSSLLACGGYWHFVECGHITLISVIKLFFNY